MGEFGGNEKWNENPFVFFAEGELINQGMEKMSPPNPIRAIYENLAPMIIRSPPAKRYPQEPSGTASFNILTDPLSALMPTSAVPDPIIGLTTQRTMRPTVQGKEGMATHLNIIVDTSGSMLGPESYEGATCYGYSPQGFALGGEDIAMIVVAMMVGQASLSGDSFAIFSFNRGAKVVWEGPSQDYSACMDYLLAPWSPGDANRPFAPSGGTDIGAGLNLLGETMGEYDFDQSVTVVITDGSFTNTNQAKNQILNTAYTYNDNQIRAMGPVFYVIIGAETTEEDTEASITSFQEALKQNYGQPMDGCVLGFNIVVGEDGNFADFAGTLVDMARVNSGDSDITPCPRI